MALEDIFKALEAQANRDVTDCLAEARERAAGIVAEAEIEADVIRRKHAADAESSASSRTMQTLNSARLEARRTLASVRQYAVGDALDKARDRLGTVRTSPGYDALFARLLDEALEGVEGDFEVMVDPSDEALARAALADRGIGDVVKTDLKTVGGVVIALNGGRVFRRNTLEDRFEKFTGIAQADVAEILFS